MKAYTYLSHERNPKKPNKILYKSHRNMTPYYKTHCYTTLITKLVATWHPITKPVATQHFLQSLVTTRHPITKAIATRHSLQRPLLHGTLYKGHCYTTPYYKVRRYTALFTNPIATRQYFTKSQNILLKSPILLWQHFTKSQYYFGNIL